MGRAVAYALSRGKELEQLTLEELQTFSDGHRYDTLCGPGDVEQVVNRRTSEGGTASTMVEAAIKNKRRSSWRVKRCPKRSRFDGGAIRQPSATRLAPLPSWCWVRYWP